MALDPRRPITCRGCGETFARDPERPKRQYCTWDCFKASRHVIETCTVCGAEFDSYLSEARKREARGHKPCCSRACRNSYTSTLLGGDGEWVPGGKYKPGRLDYRWRVVRAAYLQMVGNVCEGCEGAPVEHVHHLHPRGMGGAVYRFDNLMAVCADCHLNMHDQIRAGAFWDSFEGVEFDAGLPDHARR